MARTFKVKLVHPNAPEILRLVHENVVTNKRARKTPRVSLPPLVTRATMVVKENRIMPVRVSSGGGR